MGREKKLRKDGLRRKIDVEDARRDVLARELLSDWPVGRWQDRKLLVGVSGGADSVALLLALHELAGAGQLVVGHLNHNWRGQESLDDQAFVEEMCASLNRPCFTALLQDRDSGLVSRSDDMVCRDAAMLAKGLSCGDEESDELVISSGAEPRTEERARQARYRFFKECAYKVGASYILTAHTADDRVETLLHNLLRGTGLAGASSLVMLRPFDEDLMLVRPLLRKRRSEIESFLHTCRQPYRVDSSNFQMHYCRNFLRREALPLLAGQYPCAADNLLRFSELAEELSSDLDELAQRWLEELATQLGEPGESRRLARERWPAADYFLAPIAAMTTMPWSVIQIALRLQWQNRQWPLVDMSRTHWQALRELCQQKTGVLNLPGNLRAEVNDGYLAIGRRTKNLDTKILG